MVNLVTAGTAWNTLQELLRPPVIACCSVDNHAGRGLHSLEREHIIEGGIPVETPAGTPAPQPCYQQAAAGVRSSQGPGYITCGARPAPAHPPCWPQRWHRRDPAGRE